MEKGPRIDHWSGSHECSPDPCALQTEVVTVAAKAIKAVHGMDYVAGALSEVLCMYIHHITRSSVAQLTPHTVG